MFALLNYQPLPYRRPPNKLDSVTPADNRLTKSVRHLRYSYIVSGQLGFQAKIKETLTSISSSLWPFDEDSYFSAFCEMCQTFPFVYAVQDAM